MTIEVLVGSAGAILSLLFSYMPGFKTWFEKLGTDPDDDWTRKRLVMLGFLVVVVGGAFALACVGSGSMFGITLTCDTKSAWGLVQLLLLAIMANQSVYKISPRK